MVIKYPYVCMVITCSKGEDQPGKVVKSAYGRLNRKNSFSLSPFAPENLVSRDGFVRQSCPATACSSPYSG